MQSSDERAIDQLAVQSDDAVMRQGDSVQDEIASAGTVHGQVAQVQVAQHLAILYAFPHAPGGIAHIWPGSQRPGNVVIVLVLPSTRVSLPHGQTFAGLQPGQAVHVSGTLNWRTHILLRPSSFVVGAAPRTQQCTMLSVTGDEECAVAQ